MNAQTKRFLELTAEAGMLAPRLAIMPGIVDDILHCLRTAQALAMSQEMAASQCVEQTCGLVVCRGRAE